MFTVPSLPKFHHVYCMSKGGKNIPAMVFIFFYWATAEDGTMLEFVIYDKIGIVI